MSYNNDIMFSNMGQRCTAMNDQALMSAAPSIFATAPREDVSKRYSFIPTIDVVEGMRDIGWFPVEAKQTNVRNKSNIDTTKHMIRFQNPDIKPHGYDGLIPEAILRNAHDRTSAYNFSGGLYRALCSNGLVTCDERFGEINIHHTTKSIEQVIAACFELAAHIPNIMDRIEEMRTIELTLEQQIIFAKSALRFKYGVHSHQQGDTPQPVAFGISEMVQMRKVDFFDPENICYIPIKPSAVLRPRRSEEMGDNGWRAKSDLWTTFNVIQENLTKGGPQGYTLEGKRTKVREVKAISKEVKLNKALWSMAEYLGNHAA